VFIMNEHETDPQSGIPAGGPSPHGEQPTAPQPITPPSAWSQPAPQPQPQPASQPQSAPPSAPPASPWQQPQPSSAPPHGPYGYQPQPGYPHYGAYQTQPQPQYAYAAGPEQPGQTTEYPAWAQPVGEPQRDPARSARGRRILVTGAVAVLIALGAGGVGAATALAFDNNNGSSAIKTSDSSVTRVVDRSSLAQIASSVRDSVVSITTDSGEGSGVIFSTDGYIVTNNHVVATATGNTVNIIFANGKKATATIVGTDPRTDLAVVKATGVSGLKAATFGSSAKMQVGDTVLALGSPLGLEGSVTSGIISAKDRTIQSSSDEQQDPQQSPFGNGNGNGQQSQSSSTTMSGLIQTDAPINPGNSGGALVNTNGEVIGINSAIATSGSNSGNIGLGFAIPSDKVVQVANALKAGQKVSHPALGVSVTEADGGGALVSNVTANSAAAKAGLQQGEVITLVNNMAVNDSDDLVGAIQAASVGDKVTIQFTRNGAQQTVQATLAEAG
jgi:putative serine protease PepD